MNRSVFDFVSNLDTLIAVIIGAMLATLGALFAELIQDRMNRRRRERDAARFFGEVLFTIDRLLDRAVASQKFGDPWGPVTRRMFKMAVREADVYQRNRERLFDIRDPELRSRIHAHFITELFPLEAIVEYCEDLHTLQRELEIPELPPSQREKLECQAGEIRDIRARALELLVDEREKTNAVCEGLVRLAGVSFDRLTPESAGGPPPIRGY